MSDQTPPPSPDDAWDDKPSVPPPPTGGEWDALPPPPPSGWDQSGPFDTGSGFGGPTGPPPQIGMRLLARILDGLIVGIPMTILLAGNGITLVENYLLIAVSFLYQVALEGGNDGQTVAKKLLGLRVRQRDGQPMTMALALKRNAFVATNLVPGALGSMVSFGAAIGIAVTAMNDPAGEGFHDKFAGARVIRTR
jgi:uncharacterized RDD family membrane protein YckC